ncbi:transposon Tf2-9 polyprotein [Trichonephila clavipes]|nr:transposon Tf2-9 polyprotein [Trichonephila clavipes]
MSPVKNCPDCIKYKASNQKPSELLQTPVPAQRFEILAIDLFGSLPESKDGKRWILIIEDCTTKWVELFALPNATAKECAITLIEEVLLRYMVFLAALSVTMEPRDLKPRLAILVQEKHDCWSEKLPFIRFALNTAKCETTGQTAAFLNFGRELRTPSEVVNDIRVVIQKDNFVPEITPYLKKFAKFSTQIREVVEEQQDIRKFYADKKRKKAPIYQPGEHVFVASHTLSNAPQGRSAKLMPRRDSPCVILTQRSPSSFEIAILDNPGEPLGVYHTSALTPCNNDKVKPLIPLRKRGRPPKVPQTPGSSSESRRNQRGRMNRRTTAQQVANQFLAASGKQISRKTVARRLRGGGLSARRPVVCVPLTRQHRTARLQWCREHHNWTKQDWACVLFSDEKNIQEKDRYPACSIMVWAGIMINGRTRLHVVANGTMTGQRYLDEVLLPHVRLFRGAVGDKFVFMDDNATCHRTLAVQDCLYSEGVQRLVWPARSPNLNPIENVWDALGRQVAGRNYPPTNKNTLIRALTEEWVKSPQQLLDNVVHINGDRYRATITNFFIPELNNHDVQELWFQQDGATCHTARATIDLLKYTFGDRLISRFGPVNWPPRSCDLTPLDYFLWGYVKSLVYARDGEPMARVPMMARDRIFWARHRSKTICVLS